MQITHHFLLLLVPQESCQPVYTFKFLPCKVAVGRLRGEKTAVHKIKDQFTLIVNFSFLCAFLHLLGYFFGDYVAFV